MIEVALRSKGRLRVYPDSVDASEVQLTDIAFGLSHVCRFSGQMGQFSVAEHSVNLSRWARSQGRDGYDLRALLLHDAPECLGFGDFHRYIKRAIANEEYARLDRLVIEALWSRFCPDARPWEEYERGVKNFDRSIGAIEAMSLGAPYDPLDLPYFEKSPVFAKPRFASPAAAMGEWMHEWERAVV